ncbi:MAG: sensor histidine kinase [Noviherbaspirillum sp.]
MHSIRVTLLKWLVLPLLALNLVGGGLMYQLAWTPAQVAFDSNLGNEAWALISRLHLREREVQIELPRQAEEMLRVDRFDLVYFVVKNSAGKVIAGDRDFPLRNLPETFDTPLTYDHTMRGSEVRIAALKTMIGAQPIFVGVAETLRKRDQVRSRIIFKVALMQALLNLLLGVVVWLGVGRGLRPLQKVRSVLNARNHEDLSALPERHVAVELRPLVDAIDGLLERAQNTARARQEFLADVAHQLRTPLAGVKTQLEWLQHKHGADQEVGRSCAMAMSSVDRMVRQTNQLLALARAEPGQFRTRQLEIVELDNLVGESVQHFVQEAARKAIDLGFELHPTRVTGDRFLLRDMIDNLIDNAIRYSPRAGMVTVRCSQNAAGGLFSVEDGGPGISPEDREKVFKRFHRLDSNANGSGLGLAIVRDIARDHDAQISIMPGPEGKGTIFSVQIPLR